MKNPILCKPKIAYKSNNCDMPTQIAKLIKYLNKVSTITVMTVPSTFLSFEKKFLINIWLFSTLLARMLCVFGFLLL